MLEVFKHVYKERKFFMDNINDISTIISTIGFPIVAFVAIFYLYDKTVKELTVTIAKIDSTLSHILSRLFL